MHRPSVSDSIVCCAPMLTLQSTLDHCRRHQPQPSLDERFRNPVEERESGGEVNRCVHHRPLARHRHPLFFLPPLFSPPPRKTKPARRGGEKTPSSSPPPPPPFAETRRKTQ